MQYVIRFYRGGKFDGNLGGFDSLEAAEFFLWAAPHGNRSAWGGALTERILTRAEFDQEPDVIEARKFRPVLA